MVSGVPANPGSGEDSPGKEQVWSCPVSDSSKKTDTDGRF